jgi:hypothetical protein
MKKPLRNFLAAEQCLSYPTLANYGKTIWRVLLAARGKKILGFFIQA